MVLRTDDNFLLEQIKDIISPYAQQMQLDIVEINIKNQNRKLIIEVLLDHINGGIKLSECELINRKLLEIIEEKDIIKQEYYVEVSSPGIDRPLKAVNDFKRVIGRNIRVHLIENLQDKKEYLGELKDVMGEKIIINLNIDSKKRESSKDNLTSISIPISKISKAIQIV